MGGAQHHRVVGVIPGRHADAAALARRILTRSARLPAEMELTWQVGDVSRLVPIRRQLDGARIQADLVVDDPGPVCADLVANGVTHLDASQSTDAGTWTSLHVDNTGEAPTGSLAWSFRGDVTDVRDALVERVQAAWDVGLLGPTTATEIVTRFVERIRPGRDTAQEFTVDGARVTCPVWDSRDGMAVPQGLLITLPRLTGTSLAGCTRLWRTDRPVSVDVEAGRGVDAALRVAAHRPTGMELTIGPVRDDAGPGVLDAVLPLISTDRLVVQWYCRWPDAEVSYNAVRLGCNTTVDWEDRPGTTEVVVSVNYKSDCDEVVRRIAEENGVRLEQLDSG